MRRRVPPAGSLPPRAPPPLLLARVMALAVALLLLLPVASPGADAQQGAAEGGLAAQAHTWAWQVLPGAGIAQVREALLLTGTGDTLRLEVPAGAREVQAFAGGGPAPWAWVAPGVLSVDLPPPSAGSGAEPGGDAGAEAQRRVEVRYVVPVGPTGVAASRALTLDTARLRVEAALPEGWEARLDGTAAAPDGTATLGPLAAGTRVTVHLAPEAGPSPLVVLGVLLAVTLGGTMLRALTARGRARAQPQAEMGLLDHVRELQGRLRVALLVVGALMLGLFAFSLRTIEVAGLGPVAVPVPSLEDNIAAQTFRLLSQQFVPPGVELVVVSPITGALVQVEVALFLALLVGSPVIAYEVGMFLMPALLPNERRLLLRAIPAVTGLFVAGALFAYVVMVPTMMGVLYGYAHGLGARPFLALDSLVSFAIIVTLLFGATFELPVGMVALAKLGVASPREMAAKWRHVVVGVFVVAAVITPDPSVVSQLLVAIPMLGLYLAGLVVARVAVRAPTPAGQGTSA